MTQGGTPCSGTIGAVSNLFILREGQAWPIIWSFLFHVNCSCFTVSSPMGMGPNACSIHKF